MIRAGRQGTLWILVGAAALVGGLLLLDRDRPSTDEARQAALRLDPRFDRGRVSRIELERGGERTQLIRDAEGWWLTDPRRRADDPSVEALLSTLELARIERRLRPSSVELAALGLAPPKGRLRAGGLELELGGDAPGERDAYLRRAGDPEVLVVERRLRELVEEDPLHWLSLRPTLGAPERSLGLSVGALALERRAGAWLLVRPLRARAEQARVDALREALGEARATRLAPAQAKLDRSASLVLALDGRAQAWLGGPCPGAEGERLIERADGARLCFAVSALEPLLAAPERYRELRVWPIELDEVSRIGVERGGQSIALERKEGRWTLLAPAEAAGPAADGPVRALVERWVKLRLLEPGASAEAGAAAALRDPEATSLPAAASLRVAATIRLGGSSGEVVADLAEAGGQVWARRGGEPDWLPLPRASAPSLTALLGAIAADLRALHPPAAADPPAR